MEIWRQVDTEGEDIIGGGGYTSDSEASSIGFGSITTEINHNHGPKKVFKKMMDLLKITLIVPPFIIVQKLVQVGNFI